MQISLNYAPFTTPPNASEYRTPSLTQKPTVKSLIVNYACPSCNLHQNFLDELANVTHRFQVSKLLSEFSGFLENIVLDDSDVLEHRSVELEKKRREIIKTARIAEMPDGF